MTHICVGKLTIIGSDNGLSPGRRQAIIWTNAGILLIEPLGTNFNEILIKINIFSFKKMHLKMSFGKWRPFCLSLNVLMKIFTVTAGFLTKVPQHDAFLHIYHFKTRPPKYPSWAWQHFIMHGPLSPTICLPQEPITSTQPDTGMEDPS